MPWSEVVVDKLAWRERTVSKAKHIIINKINYLNQRFKNHLILSCYNIEAEIANDGNVHIINKDMNIIITVQEIINKLPKEGEKIKWDVEEEEIEKIVENILATKIIETI